MRGRVTSKRQRVTSKRERVTSERKSEESIMRNTFYKQLKYANILCKGVTMLILN